ncbi:MAG: hypothetical protein SGJ07_11010 [Rhodospirillaceae bacterium]|nr:hypothetical protein [Rhodospirillaceae bacterium]
MQVPENVHWFAAVPAFSLRVKKQGVLQTALPPTTTPGMPPMIVIIVGINIIIIILWSWVAVGSTTIVAMTIIIMKMMTMAMVYVCAAASSLKPG